MVTCQNEVDKTRKHPCGQILSGEQTPLWTPVKHSWKPITSERTTIRPTKHRLLAWSTLKNHQNQAAVQWGFPYASFNLNAYILSQNSFPWKS